MPLAVFALAAINVAIGTQSFVFAGLLSELAGDLGISIGTAGLLVPASSITFAVAAPFATALVSRIERKRVMVASLGDPGAMQRAVRRSRLRSAGCWRCELLVAS